MIFQYDSRTLCAAHIIKKRIETLNTLQAYRAIAGKQKTVWAQCLRLSYVDEKGRQQLKHLIKNKRLV